MNIILEQRTNKRWQWKFPIKFFKLFGWSAVFFRLFSGTCYLWYCVSFVINNTFLFILFSIFMLEILCEMYYFCLYYCMRFNISSCNIVWDPIFLSVILWGGVFILENLVVTIPLKLLIYYWSNSVFNIIDQELTSSWRGYSTDNLYQRYLGKGHSPIFFHYREKPILKKHRNRPEYCWQKITHENPFWQGEG